MLLIFVFVISIFLGFELITRVPSQLHTPLMSGTIAVTGIVIVGALMILRNTGNSPLATVLGFCAVTLTTLNVVGGYLVTDRMLKMFKTGKKEEGK